MRALTRSPLVIAAPPPVVGALRRWAIGASLVAIGLTSPTALAGQSAKPGWRLWAAGGLGFGGGDADGGIAALSELVFQRAPHQVSVRAVAIADLFNEGCTSGLGEVGLLYGRTATGPLGHASISAGLAVTMPSHCGLAGPRPTVLGVPLSLEAALRLAPVVGIGAQAFANLNGKGSFGGLVVFVQLGWLPR
jgi:hypothetical protein